MTVTEPAPARPETGTDVVAAHPTSSSRSSAAPISAARVVSVRSCCVRAVTSGP